MILVFKPGSWGQGDSSLLDEHIAYLEKEFIKATWQVVVSSLEDKEATVALFGDAAEGYRAKKVIDRKDGGFLVILSKQEKHLNKPKEFSLELLFSTRTDTDTKMLELSISSAFRIEKTKLDTNQFQKVILRLSFDLLENDNVKLSPVIRNYEPYWLAENESIVSKYQAFINDIVNIVNTKLKDSLDDESNSSEN